MTRGALRFAATAAAVAIASYAAAHAIGGVYPGIQFVAFVGLFYLPIAIVGQLLVDLLTNRRNRNIRLGLERDPEKRVVVPRREVVRWHFWAAWTWGFAITGALTAPTP